MQIDPMAQVSNILRALIGDAGHIVFVDEHGGSVMFACCRELLDIDYRSVGDATRGFKPCAAFALDLIRGSSACAATERTRPAELRCRR